jgi:hypothetical protein
MIEIVWPVNLCSMIVIGLPTANYVSLTSNGWILFAMCGLLLKLDRWGNCIVGYSIGIYGDKTIQSISLEWIVLRLSKAVNGDRYYFIWFLSLFPSSLRVLKDALFVENTKHRFVTWLVNWKGFRQKLLGRNLGNIPSFTNRNFGKPRKTSVSVVCVPAENIYSIWIYNYINESVLPSPIELCWRKSSWKSC